MARGYTKIENDLLEFLYCNNLSGYELKILLFLIRYTKGFNRNTVRAGYSYISKGVGCCESTAKKSLSSLKSKGYITIEYPAIGSAAQVVKLSYDKFTIRGGTRIPPEVIQNYHDKVVLECPQDIKEDIKDTTEKKERKNHHFSGNIVEMSDEEWAKMNEEDFDDE